MKKLILGLVAAAAVAAPLALIAGPANAAPAPAPAPVVSTARFCVPLKATPAVTFTEYKYAATVKGTALSFWSAVQSPAGITAFGIKYLYTGETHEIVVIPAFAGVNCAVTLPQFEAQNVCTTNASATVPVTPHVKTFLLGVNGYLETVAITKAVTVTPAMADQFWIKYQTDEGYTATNAGQWHIDFNAPCSVTLPDFQIDNVCGPNASATVPFTPHVQTFLLGVPGYDEHVAITSAVTVTSDMVNGSQFWIKYTPEGTYRGTNVGTWHIDFYNACSAGRMVTLPQFEAKCTTIADASVTVPFTPHVKTFLYGVTGYDQNVPITAAVTVTPGMAGQFWIGYVTDDGYTATNPGQGQSHIDFNASCPAAPAV